MIIYTLPVFFAWFRHLQDTPPGQGRAGANFSRCAQRLHQGPSRACRGLDRWGRLRQPEPGHWQLAAVLVRLWWATQLWPQR